MQDGDEGACTSPARLNAPRFAGLLTVSLPLRAASAAADHGVVFNSILLQCQVAASAGPAPGTLAGHELLGGGRALGAGNFGQR